MPSRVIRGEFVTSASMLAVSIPARHTFTLLILTCDDYGRTDARRSILLSQLYPGGDVSLHQLEQWLDELRSQGCVRFYTVDGREYLHLPGWERHRGQSRRGAKSRFPHPDLDCTASPEIRDITCTSPDFPSGVGVGGGGGVESVEVEEHAPVLDAADAPSPADDRWLDSPHRLTPKQLARLVAIPVRGIPRCEGDVIAWFIAKAPVMVAHGRTQLGRTAINWWQRARPEEIAEAKLAYRNRAFALHERAHPQPAPAPPPPLPAADAFALFGRLAQ